MIIFALISCQLMYVKCTVQLWYC